MVSNVLSRTDPLRVDGCSMIMSPTDGGSVAPDCSVFSGSTPSYMSAPHNRATPGKMPVDSGFVQCVTIGRSSPPFELCTS